MDGKCTSCDSGDGVKDWLRPEDFLCCEDGRVARLFGEARGEGEGRSEGV